MRKDIGGLIKYFLIALAICTGVILYVYQNIEVMRIKMDFSQLSRDEREVVKKRDALLAAIERLRRTGRVNREAEGAVKIKPEHIDVIPGSSADGR